MTPFNWADESRRRLENAKNNLRDRQVEFVLGWIDDCEGELRKVGGLPGEWQHITQILRRVWEDTLSRKDAKAIDLYLTLACNPEL